MLYQCVNSGVIILSLLGVFTFDITNNKFMILSSLGKKEIISREKTSLLIKDDQLSVNNNNYC